MGYYTTYNLTWRPQPGYKEIPSCEHNATTKFCPECGVAVGVLKLDDAVGKEILCSKEANTGFYGIDEKGDTTGSTKWYEWQPDMVKLSKKFRNVLFKLHGEGEENDDIWDAYFLNGKYQIKKARIVIDPVDPAGWEVYKE